MAVLLAQTPQIILPIMVLNVTMAASSSVIDAPLLSLNNLTLIGANQVTKWSKRTNKSCGLA